jgi:lipopolysaccharide export system permease protein
VLLLGRYVIRTVLAYTAMVLGVLLALGALFLFISQQDDIGTGSFTSTQAMLFVALYLPTYLSQLMPVGALIGAMLGLGNLARGSELVVMRASGVTTARLCLWLGAAGLILALVMTGIGEVVAPPLEKYARQVKVFSKYSEFSFAGNRGTWVRDGDTIISIEQQSAGARFGGVQVFRFDGERRLQSVGRADAASIDPDNRWRLEGYAETTFTDAGTEATLAATREVRSRLSADFLGLAVIEPETMRLRDLRSYIAHLQRNDLDSRSFEAAFWARIARVAAMLLVRRDIAFIGMVVVVGRFIIAAGRQLAHVHLQDADGHADRHWAPGEGTILWRSVFDAVARHCDNPRLILELNDKGKLVQAQRYLEDLGVAY